MLQLRQKHPEAEEAKIGTLANGFKRILACKSFKKSSTALCEALATLTKTLCTEFVDPTLIEALVASRLIPLDKGKEPLDPSVLEKC